MGVTIQNKQKSIDMGCGGFSNLRNTIAGLLSKEFQTLYIEWTKPFSSITNEEGNKMLSKLYEDNILTDNDDILLDFLFASDCGGKLSIKGCKRLHNLIKDYDDNILYGYIGRKDCAKFKDFKEIVELCVKNKWIMSWY